MRFARAAALGLVMMALPLPLAAQGTDSPAAEAADNADVLARAREQLVQHYVLPQTGEALAAALARAEAEGRFSGLAGQELAAAVNAVMHEVTPDGHLIMQYNPGYAASLAEYPEGVEPEQGQVPPRQLRAIELNNGGVRRLEVLPGNVRYMEYTGFMWGSPAAEAAIDNAMQFLRGGSAAIIDIRRNGGGSPEAVAALTSYFVPAGTALMRFEMRGRNDQATVARETAFSLADRPVYVLTSERSFSAAEEFAAHVDAFDFATLIGETTGGGGFRNDFFPLPGGYVISISTGQAIQVESGRGWEQTGIAPQIAVPADRALDRALAEAIAALVPTAPDGERQALERLLPYYRALADNAQPTQALASYAGTYGERTIALDAAGALTTRRGPQPATRLVALGGDVFAPESSPAQRFRFVVTEGGGMALEVEGPNGVQRSERTG